MQYFLLSPSPDPTNMQALVTLLAEVCPPWQNLQLKETVTPVLITILPTSPMDPLKMQETQLQRMTLMLVQLTAAQTNLSVIPTATISLTFDPTARFLMVTPEEQTSPRVKTFVEQLSITYLFLQMSAFVASPPVQIDVLLEKEPAGEGTSTCWSFLSRQMTARDQLSMRKRLSVTLIQQYLLHPMSWVIVVFCKNTLVVIFLIMTLMFPQVLPGEANEVHPQSKQSKLLYAG